MMSKPILKSPLMTVNVEQILPNPDQPRKEFDADALAALAESIKRHGLLQPIAIRRIAEQPDRGVFDFSCLRLTPKSAVEYEIVSGERRFRAARLAGLTEVPCLLFSCTQSESAELAIIENIQREDLSPFEEAAALRTLLDAGNITQEEIAARLSVSQAYVANKLRLLRLTPEERSLIQSSHLTERHARALLKLENPEERTEVLKQIIKNHMNVSQSESLICSRAQQPPERKPKPRQVRKMAACDLRLFTNTIEHAVDSIAKSGFEVTRERRENADSIEYIIRFPLPPSCAS